jgi:predicted Zn-dependent protease
MDSLRSQTALRVSFRRSNGTAALETETDGETDQQASYGGDNYQESSGANQELDQEQEWEEGQRQQEELLQRYPLWESPPHARLLDQILETLWPLSSRPEVAYEFLALDTETPFASSCCHGAVYFSRGLLLSLSQEGVLFWAAHEMAHTELRHYASRQQRLVELRRAIPAAPHGAARQRMELAAVLAVRHQEEFEADHLAAQWLDPRSGQKALEELHQVCLRSSPESLSRPTHPPFERRVERVRERLGPPDPVDYLWSLLS